MQIYTPLYNYSTKGLISYHITMGTFDIYSWGQSRRLAILCVVHIQNVPGSLGLQGL